MLPISAIEVTEEELDLIQLLRKREELYCKNEDATRIKQDVDNKLECVKRDIERAMSELYEVIG